MNSDESMRAINAVIKDLILHIQELEAENASLRDKVCRQSHKLTALANRAQELDVKNIYLCHKTDAAIQYIKDACCDDGMRDKTVRRLWKALDILGG